MNFRDIRELGLNRDHYIFDIRSKNISISIIECAQRTPIYCPNHDDEKLSMLTDTSLFFKCENFQKVGAFKMRVLPMLP